MNEWQSIFKAGRHTDSGGVEHTITTADLDRIVESYDPQEHEAPLVIGHPKTDSPAFGWVAGLKRQGDRLLARFAQVPDEVREMVRAGRYKHVSVALYPDRKLRHVGLLGAAPPAVKGLGAVEFADREYAVYEFSQGDENVNEVEELKAKVASLTAERDAAQTKAQEAEKARDAAFAERDKANLALAEAAEEQKAKQREARFAELVKAGKVLPAEKERTMDTARLLGKVTDMTFADGKGGKIGAEENFWRSLEERPPGRLLGEFAEAPGQTEGNEAGAVNAAARF